ncbi:MAG: zinc metallopeptidase [Christensenellales bacterium]
MDKYKLIAIIACIVLILLIIVLSSRSRILRTYKKYMKIGNKANITGEQLALFARKQLQLNDLQFALTKQKLGDAYSPKYKTLILSEEVCYTASLASLTIVSHELGHVQQDKQNNSLFILTRVLGLITRLTNALIIPTLIIGIFLYIFKFPNNNIGYILLIISGCMFCLHLLNKILTIPLEYDASRRALKYLKENKFVSDSELRKAKKLLNVAAQTYIASLLDGILILNTKNRKRKKK